MSLEPKYIENQYYVTNSNNHRWRYLVLFEVAPPLISINKVNRTW